MTALDQSSWLRPFGTTGITVSICMGGAQIASMPEIFGYSVRLGVGGPDAAALGAASVVLHRRLTPHRSIAPV